MKNNTKQMPDNATNFPTGNCLLHHKFYFATANPSQHQSFATNNGIPTGYFYTEDNLPTVKDSNNYTHYLPFRLPQKGDIVFNTNPIPNDISEQKKGYIGYMCTQSAIMVLDAEGYVLINDDLTKFDDKGKLITLLYPVLTQPAIWKCFGKIFLLVLGLLIGSDSFAQGWVKTYGQAKRSEMGKLITQNNDTLLISVRDRQNVNNKVNYKNSLWALDYNGDTLFTKLPGSYYKYIATKDNNLVFSADKIAENTIGRIVKTTTKGDTLWTYNEKLYGGKGIELHDSSFLFINHEEAYDSVIVYEPGDTTFYIEYAIPALALHISHVNSQGQFLNDTVWLNRFSKEPADYDNVLSNCVLPYKENKFIVAGRSWIDFNSTSSFIALFEGFDTPTLLWRNTEAEGEIFDLYLFGNENILTLGSVEPESLYNFQQKSSFNLYSIDGKLLKQLILPDSLTLRTNPILALYSDAIFSMPYNDVVFTFLYSKDNAYLYSIDSELNMQLIATYDFPKPIKPVSICYDLTDGYYITGSYYPNGISDDISDTIYTDLVLIKTNNNFSCAPYSQFALTQTDSLVTLTNTSFGGDTYKWVMGNGDTLLNQPTTTTYIYPTKGVYQICLVAENLCGKNQHCQTINYGSVGINNTTITPINISQTANNEVIIGNLSQTPILSVKLYNSCGQLMYHQEAPNSNNGSYTLTTHHLPPGLYQVIAQTSQGMCVGKVVVW